MGAAGFEPELIALEAIVLPDYTTLPHEHGTGASYLKFITSPTVVGGSFTEVHDITYSSL